MEFTNVLVIHFGQLGDVVLGLPALSAIKHRLAKAKITVMSGKSTAEIVRISGVADEQIVVDRVGLRDGNTFRSIAEVFSIVRDVRRRRFDLVVDLHSLHETNLLGFVSGASSRLFANRGNRSLDRLTRFPVKPPREDKTKHLTDRYLDVLQPLGVTGADRQVCLSPAKADVAHVRQRFFEGRSQSAEKLVGLFPGAGHPSRCWKLSNFAELAGQMAACGHRPVVFLGPEEEGMRDEVESIFPAGTTIVERLTIAQFIAAVSLVTVFVTNDTGPLHLAAGAGVSIVLLLDERAPLTYLPITDKMSVVRSATIDEITVEQVAAATRKMFA